MSYVFPISAISCRLQVLYMALNKTASTLFIEIQIFLFYHYKPGETWKHDFVMLFLFVFYSWKITGSITF